MNYHSQKSKNCLTIIIPTFNRPTQIEKTLSSISKTMKSAWKDNFQVILVDNNSNLDNKKLYIDLVKKFSDKINISHLIEPRQGRSHACNSGAEKATSDWIAFIDDDEMLTPSWLDTAFQLIDSDEFSYYGGPYLPEWEIPPPPWLPIHQDQYRGALGWIEFCNKKRNYDDFDAELCGGNILLKRALYLKIGGFSSALGRGANNLLGGEDGEFHRRLKRAKAKGCYCPQLSVRHWIPVSRMTIAYHRRWAFWSGVSNRIRIATEPQTGENLPHLLGIPRYWFAKGSQGLGRYFAQGITGRLRKSPEGVIGLLDFMYLVGLLRGKVEGRRLGISMKPTDIRG